MSDERAVVSDVLEETAKPDKTVDPLPEAGESHKPAKRVRKPRKAR